MRECNTLNKHAFVGPKQKSIRMNYLEQRKMHQEKDQIRLIEPEIIVSKLYHWNSLHNGCSVLDLLSHFHYNDLKLCTDYQDHLVA